MKKGQYSQKFNTYRCACIKHDVITPYYPNPDPDYKKDITCGARNPNPNPNPNPKAAKSRKGRLFAALGLGLGFLGLSFTLTATSNYIVLFFTHPKKNRLRHRSENDHKNICHTTSFNIFWIVSSKMTYSKAYFIVFYLFLKGVDDLCHLLTTTFFRSAAWIPMQGHDPNIP